MRAYFLFLVACLLPMWLTAPQAAAAPDYRGPSPEWVLVDKLPDVNEARISQATGGLYYLMVDDQVRWTSEVETFHRRFAYKVIDRLGLEEGARITVEFDPTHQEVDFHSISVHRNGLILDRLGNARIKTYQQEKRLSEGIVDGNLTAHVDIPDLRVGDIVEYTFSIASRPELALNEFSDTVRMRWSVPVSFNRYRLSLPRDKGLSHRSFDLGISPAILNEGEETVYEWTLLDADPVPAEEDVPSWNIAGSFQVSTYGSWDTISKGILPYYGLKEELPEDFAARVDDIAGKFSDENDRVTEALRLVQDTIRYVGIEIGPGALIPRTPEQTLSRGYGDCKDKSMLLIAALRRMGIDAVPALVNLKNGYGLPERLPGLGMFDHVIVRVESAGKVYWLDPTLSHQGGRMPKLAVPDYGYALPVAAQVNSLEQIHVAAASLPTSKLTETFVFPPKENEKLTLHARTVYLGIDADNYRYSLAKRGVKDFERSYYDYYNKLYPGIASAKPISITDDRDRNRIIVEEQYDLAWAELNNKGLANNFPLSASNLDSTLKTPKLDGRRLPIALSYPLYRQHNINVLGLQTRFEPPGIKSRTIDALRFEFTSTVQDDALHLSWELETRENEIPRQAAKQYLEVAAEIGGSTYWTYDFLYSDAGSDWAAWLGVAAVFVLLGVPLVWGTVYGIRADREYADRGIYFPVSVSKFVVMSTVTLGLYPVFWMYKFWQWPKRFEAAKIWPVARAVFAPIYLFYAYDHARLRFGGHAPAASYGVAGAVIYLLGTVGSIHFDEDWRGSAAMLLGFVGFLPAVMCVNKLNEAEPYALKQNSRFNNWNILGIVLGVLIWGLVLFFLWASQFAPNLLQ